MLPENIAARFRFEGEATDIRPLGEGLINDTYLVETAGNGPDYILQRKNKNVFRDVPAMMDNIWRVTRHLKAAIVARGGDPLREALTVIPAADGRLYWLDGEGEYWAACLYIAGATTFQRAGSSALAFKGGRGIGRFHAMLSGMTEPLADILPGFHDMRFRFRQWDETLKNDPAGRKAGVGREVEWIESRREQMMSLWLRFEAGEIPLRITHNDTKISNILFDDRGEALCVIDLDTALSGMCLNDYGDAIRSYANAGLEDDPNPDNVSLRMDIFEGYTRGYLSEAAAFLTGAEKEELAFSARYITFEQTLRFLMDYIDGDRYYKVRDATHNLVRARAQHKLLTSMEENYDRMRAVIGEIV
jgi:Ser/Thr protein kinase RdoA (MazF antagonist)